MSRGDDGTVVTRWPILRRCARRRHHAERQNERRDRGGPEARRGLERTIWRRADSGVQVMHRRNAGIGHESETDEELPGPVGRAIRPPRRIVRPRGSRGQPPARHPVRRALRRRARNGWARTVASASRSSTPASRSARATRSTSFRSTECTASASVQVSRISTAARRSRIALAREERAKRIVRVDRPTIRCDSAHAATDRSNSSEKSRVLSARSLIAPRAVVRVSSRQPFAANDAPAGHPTHGDTTYAGCGKLQMDFRLTAGVKCGLPV